MSRPWLDDGDVALYHGDALEQLALMPSESVHCIVTSPPFWGLRDYGTGSWTGGDADCDHAVRKNIRVESSTLGGGTKNSGHQQEGYGATCGRCGARRVDQQIGLEETPDEWCARLVAVFREARRVLRSDGVCWIEVGDTYGASTGSGRTNSFQPANVGSFTGTKRGLAPGTKQKDLVGAPWLLAFALRADGWYLRSDTIWARPNPMPESVTDRPTKAHSYVFLLTKSARYFYDADAIREENTSDREPSRKAKRNGAGHLDGTPRSGAGTPYDGTGTHRNARSVWSIATEPTPFAHFATFPQALVERCIKAGTSEHGACSECGAPWRRITESKSLERHELEPDDPRYRRARYEASHAESPYAANGGQRYSTSTMIGWEPVCDCCEPEGSTYPNPPVVPCVVLDPFMGSATTALVARRLGRHAIGIELNAEYLGIAAKRLEQLSLLA